MTITEMAPQLVRAALDPAFKPGPDQGVTLDGGLRLAVLPVLEDNLLCLHVRLDDRVLAEPTLARIETAFKIKPEDLRRRHVAMNRHGYHARVWWKIPPIQASQLGLEGGA